MRETKRRRLKLTLAAAIAALMLTPGISRVAALPGKISISAGGAVELPASSLLQADIDGTSSNESFTLTADDAGNKPLNYALLGVLPVKTVSLSVEPERRLIPGGQSVGIAIDTEGVVVVGASDIGSTPSPARLAGLRSGDIIEKVNGESISSAEELTEHLEGDNAVTLDVSRNGKALSCQVTPAMDARDGHWRLGAWVRDSTAGVGTLTFIDPETGLYGALGHAITDVDTSVTMPVGVGELYENRVVNVTPSKHGKPGELTGDFVFSPELIGTVERNTQQGIFGHTSNTDQGLYSDGLPVAHRSELHTGLASLLTSIDSGGPKEYACEIVRINNSDTRSMVIRVTDPELLERTGGIVQGMSGSPIIQDGRLVGAVTHVMINDPAMGYGIAIDAMLEAAA